MAGERPTQETYDEGRLAERIMLAALAHGVGSSVGWIVGGGRDAAREILGVPEGRMVRTAISLGYPDEGARRRRVGQARKPLSEIVHEELYG
jgi:nitroreductase